MRKHKKHSSHVKIQKRIKPYKKHSSLFMSFKQSWYKMSIFLFFLLLMSLPGLQWIISCFPEVLNETIQLFNHFNFAGFIAVETFALANLTAFISTFEFVEKKLDKGRKAHQG